MTAASNATLDLSVVVAVTSGGTHLERCLEALENQRDAPLFEVIVPIDASPPDVAHWAARFPEVEFLSLVPSDVGAGPGRQHLEYDRRRAAGLAIARAPVVALTEDHARPAPDWCRNIVRAHATHPHAAIGGTIGNASLDRLARAVYLCDFARYQSPLAEGPTHFVSDVNVSYKRAALAAVADAWHDTYHETAVHDALRAQGGTLWIDPSIAVEQQRGPLDFVASLRERYAWGRLYAGKRVDEVSGLRRAALALLSPLLPALLLARQLGYARRRRAGELLGTLPLLTILLCAWSLGEAVGYWTGRPVARAYTR